MSSLKPLWRTAIRWVISGNRVFLREWTRNEIAGILSRRVFCQGYAGGAFAPIAPGWMAGTVSGVRNITQAAL